MPFTAAFASLRHRFPTSHFYRFKLSANGHISRTGRQLLSLLLIACLLSLSVPPVFAAASMGDVLNGIGSLWRAGKERASVLTSTTRSGRPSAQQQTPSPGLPPLVRVEPRLPPSKEEREVKVAKIEVTPAGDITLLREQPMAFIAVPVDRDGDAIHGLTAEWESSDEKIVSVTPDGQALAVKPGKAKLTVSVANKQTKIKVEVISNDEPFGGKKKKDSTRQDIEQQRNAVEQMSRQQGRVRSLPAVWSPDESLRDSGVRRVRVGGEAMLGVKAVRAALVRPQGDGDSLPDDETGSLYTPTNEIGAPPGKMEAAAATPPAAMSGTEQPGSSNFSFGVPVVGLPGRGVGVSLGLSFNSRVWHQSIGGGTKYVTYDVDGGTPAPGFHLGYGHLEDQGSQGFTLVDSSGTRHQMRGIGTNLYESTDGTFIRFNGGRGWGTVIYTDGTRVQYAANAPGTVRSYPVRITDANGNFITITYGTQTINNYTYYNVGPRIDTIQDTMGRYVRFRYSGANGTGDLRVITAPGFDGGAERQVARFYYADITAGEFTHPFSGASAVAPASVRVLRYVTLPGSNYTNRNGYRFDYWNAYGTVERVTRLYNIDAAATVVDADGVVRSPGIVSDPGVINNDGQTAAWTYYNYQARPVTDDAPSYTERTDDWTGRTQSESVGGAPPVHYFATDTAAGTSTATAPNGTKTVTETFVNQSGSLAYLNGLVKKISLMRDATVLGATETAWGTGNGAPRVLSVTTTNETGQKRQVDYGYGANPYNNVESVSERDFHVNATTPGVVLRTTQTTYQTSAEYTDRRLVHLPTQVVVRSGDATGSIIARTDYAYDQTTLANVSDPASSTNHEQSYNPHTTATVSTGQCIQEIPYCDFDYNACLDEYYNNKPYCNLARTEACCQTYQQRSVYDPATDKRGNVTTVTSFGDAAGGTQANTTTTKYDIFGNPVEVAGLSCCDKKTFTYAPGYKYAYATGEVKGNTVQLTTSATYDFNTGVARTTTDENGGVTGYSYDPNTLRHNWTLAPDGERFMYKWFWDHLEWDPGAAESHTFVETWVGGYNYGPQVRGRAYTDGRGTLKRTQTQTPDGHLTSDFDYDVMGRRERTGNPYYTPDGQSGQVNPAGRWTKAVYDDLGRVMQTQFIEGASVQTLAQVSYDGAANLPASYGTSASTGMVVTATDQAGKSRRQVTDALGRVRRADEPDDAGQLGAVNTPVQATYYDYDALDNLLHSTQGVQQRYFLYDSLSRLRATRQPEMDAPRTITGSPTLNTAWSTETRYHPDGRVDEAFDANGVRTWLTYDGLNRVKTVNHSDATPGVTYDYDQARGSYRNNAQVTTVTTAAVAAVPSVSHAIPQTKQEYNYDWFGAVTAQTTTIGSAVYGQSYTYGGLGNLKSQTYPSGRVVNYGYDAPGRLTSVADTAGGATQSYLSSASYYAHGGVQSETWGNGAIHSVEFNARLQPTAINLDKSGNLLQRYEYRYGQVNIDTGAPNALNNGQVGRVDAFVGRDAGGNPLKAWEQRFAYDSTGRLSRAREVRSDTGASVWQQHFTFDRYGNRYQAPVGTPNHDNEGLGWLKVEQSDINPQTNRFTLPQITYNAAGQITQDTYFRNAKYSYDASGRVRSRMYADNTNLQTNVTDGAGQRVRSISGLSTATYIYDVFGRLCAEYNSRQPSLRSENIYRGGGGLLAVRQTATRQSAGGGYGVSTQWVLSDIAGSTRLTSGASGAVIARRDYTPFGEELYAGVGVRDNTQGYAASFSARQGYAQTERDEAMELEHTPWRKLDSKAGRWTTPDPYLGSMSVGDPQSFNRYAYVGNDPVNFVDPDGRIGILALMAVGAIVGTVVGAIGSAAGQVFTNRGFDNFSWEAVGVSAGVGFVAGGLAPIAAGSYVGAAVLGGVSNVAQYYGTQYVTGQRPNAAGAVANGVIGAVAGPLGGRFTRGTAYEFLPGNIYDPLSRTTMQNANTAATVALNTGLATLLRSAGASIFSNIFPTSGGSNSTSNGQHPINQGGLMGGGVDANPATPNLYGRSGFNPAASANAFANWVRSIPVGSGWRADPIVISDEEGHVY